MIQESGIAYTVDDSQITFTTAPAIEAEVFILAMGSRVNVGTPSAGTINGSTLVDGTVSANKITSGSIDATKLNSSFGNYGGTISATAFAGDGSALTGIANTADINAGTLNVAGVTTVGSGITLSPDGDGFFTGITTATSINVGSGITLSSDGNAFHTGIVTATSVTGVGTVTSVTASGIDLSGLLREGVKITAGKLSDNTNIDLENGMVHLFTTQETTTSTPNIRFSSSVTLNDVMQIGETVSVTIITTAAAGGYSAQLTIDGAAVTENWVGGDAPSDGGSSGVDIHAYTIIKTANATFTVIGNQSKTSS